MKSIPNLICKEKKTSFQPHNRRGISTVVGSMFFVILMVAGFSAQSLALNAQTDIVSTQSIVSDIDVKKQQEAFTVLASTNENNILSIGINNHGQNPVEISSIWILNKTLSTQNATRYETNYVDAFVSSGFISNVLSTQSLAMISDTYDIKVVSSLGTIKLEELVVNTEQPITSLGSVLIANPSDIILGQNVTLAMIVTNIGQLAITDVTPSLPFVNSSATITNISGPNISNVDLIPGESFLFLWNYSVNGTSNTLVSFSNIANGTDIYNNFVESNNAIDTSVIRNVTSGLSIIYSP